MFMPRVRAWERAQGAAAYWQIKLRPPDFLIGGVPTLPRAMAEKRDKKKAMKHHIEADPIAERNGLDEIDDEPADIDARALAYARLMTVEERLYKLWEERGSGPMDWIGWAKPSAHQSTKI
jgi:hypothetical protein